MLSVPVRPHPHHSDRSALVRIGRRHRPAARREARDAAVPVRRWIATRAVAPAEVAEPHRAAGIDRDAVAATENATTQQGRQRRSLLAVGRLAIGLEDQIEVTGVRRALERVVRDPGVTSPVEREIAGPADQAVIAARIVDLDRHRPGIGDGDERRRVRVAQQGQCVDPVHVPSRIAGEVRQRRGSSAWRATARRCRQIEADSL